MKALGCRPKIVTALIFASLICLVGGVALAGQGPKFKEGELLVKPKSGADPARVEQALRGQGAHAFKEIRGIGVKAVKVPAHAQEKVRAALARNPHIDFAEPNYLGQGMSLPDDPSYGTQWHLPKIAAPEGWQISTGVETVPIAVIDSGVDGSHPDLGDKLLGGYNFLNGSTDTSDVLGHGTAVAGTAAAISNNSIGVAGVAWRNPVMPLVVLDSSNYATYSNIASAIIYAVDNGAKVINVSIGGTSSSFTLQYAIDYAWDRGALVFCAAGNSNSSVPNYPAACDRAVAISSTDSSDNRSYFSSYGDWIDLAAPGSSIYTTLRGGGFGYKSGTSFASPVTAGVAALVWSVNPSLTHEEVLNILRNNADDLGAQGFDIYFGHGRVNLAASLGAAGEFVPEADGTAPEVSVASPAEGEILQGTVSFNVAATDDNGVKRVEFLIDGQVVGSDSSAPYAWSWDTTQWNDGGYVLSARAVDPSGNEGVSGSVDVQVGNPSEEEVVVEADTEAPVILITNPLPGASVEKKEQIDVQASDDNGVVLLEVYLNGSLISSTSDSTLSLRWMTHRLDSGAYKIEVRAYDAAGNMASDTVTVYK